MTTCDVQDSSAQVLSEHVRGPRERQIPRCGKKERKEKKAGGEGEQRRALGEQGICGLAMRFENLSWMKDRR